MVVVRAPHAAGARVSWLLQPRWRCQAGGGNKDVAVVCRLSFACGWRAATIPTSALCPLLTCSPRSRRSEALLREPSSKASKMAPLQCPSSLAKQQASHQLQPRRFAAPDAGVRRRQLRVRASVAGACVRRGCEQQRGPPRSAKPDEAQPAAGIAASGAWEWYRRASAEPAQCTRLPACCCCSAWGATRHRANAPGRRTPALPATQLTPRRWTAARCAARSTRRAATCASRPRTARASS